MTCNLRALLVASCLLLPGSAFGQGSVLQGGPSTAGHVPQYGSAGSQAVIMDGGGAAGGRAGVNPSELGITARGTGTPPYASQGRGPLGTNVCNYDAPIDNAAGYHYLCLSPNAQGGGLLTYGAVGAPQLPFTFNINGIDYQLASLLGLTVGTTQISGGTSLAPLFNNGGVLGNGTVSSVWSRFTPFGTGATNRTVQAKLAEWFSVLDFATAGGGNCVQDNASECSAAFAAAAAAAAAYSQSQGPSPIGPAGGTVWVPPGPCFRINVASIGLPKGVNLIGAGGLASCILADDIDAIRTNFNGFGLQTISGLTIFGVNSTAARTAIVRVGSTTEDYAEAGLMIKDNIIANFDTAVRGRTMQEVWIKDNNIINVNQCFVAEGFSVPVRITGNECQFGSGGGVGGTTFKGIELLPFDYTTGTGVINPEGVQIEHNHILGGFTTAVDLGDVVYATVTNNDLSSHGDGITFAKVRDGIFITGNFINLVGPTATRCVYGSGLAAPRAGNVNVESNSCLGDGVSSATMTGIQINEAGTTNQDNVNILYNVIEGMTLHDILVYNPGNIALRGNRASSSTTIDSINIGTVASGLVTSYENKSAKTNVYATAGDLTSGKIRRCDNTVNGGTAEGCNWQITTDSTTANRLMIGGGAGVQPAAAPAGTTTTVWHGNAGGVGSYGAVANADLANSSLTINGTTISLGASGTITAAPSGAAGGDLAGTYPNPTIGNITSGATVAGSLLHTNIAAPSTPAAGKVSVWTDSTDLRLHDKNSAGTIGTTVVADTGAASNYISAISAAGVITKSRPACATLSDSSAFCSGTDAANLTGTVASARVSGSYTGITGVGALTAGSTGAGFTLNFGTSTLSGTIPNANLTNSSLTINGTAISLGASGTVTAAAGTLTGATLAANVLASSLTSVGTLTGGATGAGFTIALGTSTVTGSLPCANRSAITGDITVPSGSCVSTLAAAQPAIHTWALAQTFTVAPVFTDQSGSRSALGLAAVAASGSASDLSAGTLPAGRMPALTGGCTTSAGAVATTCSINTPVLFQSTNQAAPYVGGLTYFFTIGEAGTEGVVNQRFGLAGTLKNLYCSTFVAPGGAQTIVFTVRVNGANTSLTSTITGAATDSVADTTHTAAVSAGDKITVSAAMSATAANTNSFSCGMVFVTTSP